jgi:ferredoxin
MAKVKLDQTLCVGCGMCAQQNPEYFEFTEEGLSSVIKEEVEAKDLDSIKDSVELCPTDAISIEEK